jgi:hypothetical protein
MKKNFLFSIGILLVIPSAPLPSDLVTPDSRGAVVSGEISEPNLAGAAVRGAIAIGVDESEATTPDLPYSPAEVANVRADSSSSPPPAASRVVAARLFSPGTQVLVAGPDGRLHSATVRQHAPGYYELDVSTTGETVWVPADQVMPDH